MKFYWSTMTITMIMLPPLVLMSSKSWLFFWVMLELNTMGVLLWFMKDLYKKNKVLLFMVFQMMSSLVIIWSLLNQLNNSSKNTHLTSAMVILLALLAKMGAYPFINWMVVFSKSLSWKENFLLTTWQKIIPLMIISKILTQTMTLAVGAMGILSSMMMMKMSHMKPTMMASSLTHTSWMIISCMNKTVWFIWYLMMYSMSTIKLFLEMSKMKTKTIYMKNNSNKSMTLSVGIMNLAGIPPMSGFIMKWIVIVHIVTTSSPITLLVTLMLSSLISFFVYTKMLMNNFIMTKMLKLKKTEKKNKNLNFWVFFYFSTPMLLFF